MDVPTSESVMNTYAGPSTNGQGIYLAADLRAGSNAGASMFWESPERYNGDLLNQVETSLGKLVGYNGQLPYNGPINWSNNITGRGVRSTSTQQVSMRDLSNYTVSNTVKENIGSSGLSVAHSASASPVRAYYAPYPIASWTSGSSFGTGSAGMFGVIAYKNNVNRPRLASFEQNNTTEAQGANSANTLYGVPTSTGSNGGDLNFNVIFNNSSVGLGNTAESVIATIPNQILYPGTSSNSPNPTLVPFSYKRQGLLIYSNLGGDSGKLYYNRYILSQSNASGLGLSLEVSASIKLPNNNVNNCVLGLVSEVASFTGGSVLFNGNFSVPFTFTDTSYSDISSATLLYTNGLGWFARVLSMTGSALYTGSSFYLGGGRYPACWRNENGAQMKNGYSIVGSLGAPFIASTNPDESIILGYQYPQYSNTLGLAAPSQSEWAANPGNNEWYRFNTGSVQIDTVIISGSLKWRSKAIEYLGTIQISGSSQNGDVVVAAMAHTGSSIDVGLYMKTGSSFIQLDYLGGIGGGTVDSTDRITLQRMNWNFTNSPSGAVGSVGKSMMNTYIAPNSASVSSSGFVGMVYSTNDIDPATKVVYLRINAQTLKFQGTSSLPTDTYGPYPAIPDTDYFFPHYPMISVGGYYPWLYCYNIGWDSPQAGYVVRDSDVPIYPLIGNYYDTSAGTSEIKMSSIALY
jgi:hypothetical protein